MKDEPKEGLGWVNRLAGVVPSFGAHQNNDRIRIEWVADGWDCSLEVYPDDSLYAHRYNVETQVDEEAEFDYCGSAAATLLISEWAPSNTNEREVND